MSIVFQERQKKIEIDKNQKVKLLLEKQLGRICTVIQNYELLDDWILYFGLTFLLIQ